MISGLSSETTYEQTENLKPGMISSVTAAPPSTWRRSSTRTFFPPRARYAALTRPLCPPPMTMASYFPERLDVMMDCAEEEILKAWGRNCLAALAHQTCGR